MREIITIDDITATRLSPWTTGTGKAGYDYHWKQGYRQGILSVATCWRSGAMNEPLKQYALWEVNIPKGQQKPPSKLLTALKNAWQQHVTTQNYIQT